MNSRGVIYIWFLIPIAIVLILVVFGVIASLRDNYSRDSYEINQVISDVLFYHQYVSAKAEVIAKNTLKEEISSEKDLGLIFNENLKLEFQEKAKESDLRIKGTESFFGKTLRGEFNFFLNGEKYVFSMEDVFVESFRGANKIRRTFDIVICFGDDGERMEC